MLIKPTKIIGYEVKRINDLKMINSKTGEVLLEMKEGFVQTDDLYEIKNFEHPPIFETEVKKWIFYNMN